MSVLRVDLDALAANHALLRQAAGGAEVAPVLKADAYGLGAPAVATRLWAEGARTFFVARISEGEALRGVAPGAVVYVLDGCPPGQAERLRDAGLRPVLNSAPQVAAWLAAGGGPAALHVDTGMNRLGLRWDGALPFDLEPELVMSHLACGTEPGHPLNRLQAERFAAVAARFPGARRSLANSAGVFLGDDWRFDLVRPGVSLFGGGPEERPDRRLAPVAAFEAEILQVRDIPAGESVGYAWAWTAEAPARVAVVGAGYADGVPRTTGGAVWHRGGVRPIVGRVSMDSLIVDVTGCDAAEGETVELFGPHLLVDDAARAAGTIAHHMLTSVGPRVRRAYV